MNQPQNWRGTRSAPGSTITSFLTIIALALVLFLFAGCVHVAMLGTMTNMAQLHQMNELKRRVELQEAAPKISSKTSPSDMALDRSSK
mgnify:CR=1 FL=1